MEIMTKTRKDKCQKKHKEKRVHQNKYKIKSDEVKQNWLENGGSLLTEEDKEIARITQAKRERDPFGIFRDRENHYMPEKREYQNLESLRNYSDIDRGHVRGYNSEIFY